jgi:hypothetical protein
MPTYTLITVLGLLGIALVWPMILAVWAWPEARALSIATFALAALAAAVLAADRWAPHLRAPVTLGGLTYPGAIGSLTAALAAGAVVAPMVTGFMAARRARERGMRAPRWLIASFLVPETLILVGGAGVAYALSRSVWGPTYDPSALGAGESATVLLAMLAAIPAALAALAALGVTVWMLVTYDGSAGGLR